MIRLAIRNGTIVTARETYQADIGVDGEKISLIGQVPSAEDEIDAHGLLILPGGVDPHTHLESRIAPDGPQSRSDFHYGTVAAACGGITTIIDYARQRSGLSLLETIEHCDQIAAAKSVIDYGFHLIPSFVDATQLAEIPELIRAGFPTVKLFMNRLSDPDILRMMHAIGANGGMAMMHCENAAIDADAYHQLSSRGIANARNWINARPKVSEYEATSRALDYAEYTGCPICIVHVSSAEVVERIRRARGAGARPWIETRPCYLLFTAALHRAVTRLPRLDRASAIARRRRRQRTLACDCGQDR